MRKSYHSTAVPITLDHTIRRKLAASSGATFRVTSSATVIDLSKTYRRHGKQLALSTEPIGSRDGKIDHVYCWKSTTRNAANAARSGKAGELHRFSAIFSDIPAGLLTIFAAMLEIHAEKFSLRIHMPATRKEACAAGLAVGRHLLQKRHQQFGRFMRA